ncbi:MAG: DUF2029 domain-containing protein [Deltaproteobacteria bacterium]|nr:DUF2029 domain-containing protein [Deltaproteobacteria bacterium]
MNPKLRRLEIATVAVLAALLMQALVWALHVYLFQIRRLGYAFLDVSDITVYHEFADLLARGLRPYRDVPFEYPPLAEPLMTLPTRLRALGSYEWVFAGGMMLFGLVATAFVAATATRLWRGLGRPLLAGAAFAAAVLLLGPIVANRFDIVVGLVMAVFVYCLARRWWWLAAATLGLGFALKLTPAMFLPLVFVLAKRLRRILLALAAFVLAALAPFVPHLPRGGRGLLHVFQYHAERPVQIESLFATPYLLGHWLDGTTVTVSYGYGSQGIAASGATLLAKLSPYLMAACLSGCYVLVWRRRQHLRRNTADLPLVLLAMVLVLVCTSKVLSPQFLVWTIPFLALVTAAAGKGRKALGLGLLLVLLATHVGFPARYWDLVALERGPILLITARNLGLLAFAIFAVVQVFRCGRPKKKQARSSESAPADPQRDAASP